MPPPRPPAEFAAVLLAGGRSSRMGRDKALLPHPVSGRPLILHHLASLQEAGAARVFLSVRHDQDYPLVPDNIPRVRDSGDGGPLPALAAALAATSAPRLLVLAVDLPHIDATRLRVLVTASTVNCGVVPFHPATDAFEPLCAVYPTHHECRAAFASALAARRLSLQRLLHKALLQGWMRPLNLSPAEARHFANWNAPSDIIGDPPATEAPL